MGEKAANYFEFLDWEKAFAYFYEQHKKDSSFALVISKHWCTSGYWIEKDPQPTTHEPELLAYRTEEEAKALEARIRAAREEQALYDEQGNFKGYPAALKELVL